MFGLENTFFLRYAIAAGFCIVATSWSEGATKPAVGVLGRSVVGSSSAGRMADKLPRAMRGKSVSVLRTGNSGNVGVAAAPIVNRPLPRAIYQRNSNNMARVSISGSCDSGLDAVEARAVARAGFNGTTTEWVTLAEFPGSTYSNDLVLAGGWYDIEVRTRSGGSPISTSRVERVGVGEIFITCGQSNSANHGAPVQSPSDDRISALNLNNMTWQLANDPQPYATGSGGSPWPDFASLLSIRTKTPVAVVAVGVGNTTVAQWVPVTGSYYPRIALAINALKPYGGFRAILWHQGENDAGAGTDTIAYANRLNAIIAQSRADAGFTVPWGVALVSWGSSNTESNMAKVLAGQWLVITNTTGVFKGAATDSFHTLGWFSDYIHFNDFGLRDHGRQWVDAAWKSVLADDRDGDGLPDLWMLTHFGHAEGDTNDFSTALDDPDGDGANNRNEFGANTDPNNPDEYLHLSNISNSNGLYRVSWPSVPGTTYRVRWTDVLTNESWSAGSALLPAYEVEMTYEADATNRPIQFFHVTTGE